MSVLMCEPRDFRRPHLMLSQFSIAPSNHSFHVETSGAPSSNLMDTGHVRGSAGEIEVQGVISPGGKRSDG